MKFKTTWAVFCSRHFLVPPGRNTHYATLHLFSWKSLMCNCKTHVQYLSAYTEDVNVKKKIKDY